MPKRKRELLKPRPCKASRSPNVSAVKTKDDEDHVSIWVQCENERCQKWRLISAEEAKGLGNSPWYCWFNRDTRYNSCSAEEQKVKKPKHMKFIYSLLPEGEVVMAKMHGYPSWPGLLTRDPTCGEYYDAPLIKEDEVTHYHVEFFGRPRSRAWLVPALVHPLRSLNEIEKIPKFRKIQGRQLMELRKSYEFALKEAHNSLNKTTDQRLATSHFKYIEEEDKPSTPKVSTEKTPLVSVEESKRLKEEDKPTSAKAVLSEQIPIIKDQATRIPERRNSATSPLNSPTIPIMMNKPWLSDNGSVSPLDLKEKEFLERLESFSVERGVTVPRQPTWRGKRINLFKFYNLVLKHGGFEKVCQSKLWNEVYNELLDADMVYGGTSSTARFFYQKYLMPFEHHLRTDKKLDAQFVPEDVSSLPHRQTGRAMGMIRRRTVSSSITDEAEQTVPGTPGPSPQGSGHNDNSIAKSSEQHSAVFRGNDQVPSSNPDSPRESLGGCSFDSDESDDESTSSACDEAEKGLQQLERLLLSLEPSLYPPTDGGELVKSRVQGEKSLSKTQQTMSTIEEVDVKKTLDEIAKIEGAIADLNSFVSLEMEQL